MFKTSDEYHQKEFWLRENLEYSQPYFRLEKCAKIVNSLSRGQPCDLLDVGCGPATLSKLLDKSINYFGIDLAIHNPALNLIELDFMKNELAFNKRKFDFVIAAGVFEYMGNLQKKKLGEIRKLLHQNGKLIVTYSNFHHFRHRQVVQRNYDNYWYNNICSIRDFEHDLALFFHVEKMFPSSHNWRISEPRRKWLKTIQMPIYVSLPIISRFLAINYFFICSLVDTKSNKPLM